MPEGDRYDIHDGCKALSILSDNGVKVGGEDNVNAMTLISSVELTTVV